MPRRKPFQREADLLELTRRYLKGETQSAIAATMNVSQMQISFDLKELRKRWRQASALDFDEAKSQELAKVDHLELTYWQAWQRSLGEKESSATSQVTGEKATLRAEFKKEQRDGNPTFLTGVQWCINKRCEILGLNAPVKRELTGADGGPIPFSFAFEGDGGNDSPG